MNQCCKDTWGEICHVMRHGLMEIHGHNKKILKGKNIVKNATDIACVIKRLETIMTEYNGKVYGAHD